jgi:DNA mismatch endonuclease (patch repair protein)
VDISPEASSELVRRQMSAQRSRDTGPELALRKALFARGLRFRIHLRIGRIRPDIVLTRAKIAVFVMGDFWHVCPTHGTSPKRNGEWWAAKLEANKQRDRRQRALLEESGWHVVWVWECEDTSGAADRVAALWRVRSGRAGASVR